MTLEAIRKMSADQLAETLVTARKELLKLRTQKAYGAQIKTHLLGLHRKTIARVKTVMNQNKASSNE